MQHLTTPSGGTIHDAAQLAITAAQHSGQIKYFTFNGIELTVYPGSFALDIVTIYMLRHEIERLVARQYP